MQFSKSAKPVDGGSGFGSTVALVAPMMAAISSPSELVISDHGE